MNYHERSLWQVIFFSCTFSCFFSLAKRKHRAKICGETFPFLMIFVVAGRERERSKAFESYIEGTIYELGFYHGGGQQQLGRMADFLPPVIFSVFDL